VSGYAVSFDDDCDANGALTITVGQTQVCTVTLDDVAPTITIIKEVDNGDGLVNPPAIPADFTVNIDGSPVAQNTQIQVLAGTHTISEDAVAEYNPTISTNIASDPGVVCNADGTVTLGIAENAVCTITNDDNQLPISESGNDRIVNEGAQIALDGTASNDPDGSIAAFLWTQTGGPTIQEVFDSSASVISFAAPQVGAGGTTVIFDLTVTDNGGLQDTSSVQIQIKNINGRPTAQSQSIAGDEDSLIPFTVVATDPDATDAIAFFTITQQPTSGTISFNPIATTNNGGETYEASGTYTPNSNFNGADSFQFTATDDTGQLNTVSTFATASITVNSINDPPVAGDDTAAVKQGGTVVINVLGGDTDQEGDSLTPVNIVNVQGATGVPVINADGTITFESDGTTPAGFTYQANDGNDLSNAATVTISIIPRPTLDSVIFTDPGTIGDGFSDLDQIILQFSNNTNQPTSSNPPAGVNHNASKSDPKIGVNAPG